MLKYKCGKQTTFIIRKDLFTKKEIPHNYKKI